MKEEKWEIKITKIVLTKNIVTTTCSDTNEANIKSTTFKYIFLNIIIIFLFQCMPAVVFCSLVYTTQKYNIVWRTEFTNKSI